MCHAFGAPSRSPVSWQFPPESKRTPAARPMIEVLPWDHVNVKKGRAFLEKEQNRSLVQLEVMATAE